MKKSFVFILITLVFSLSCFVSPGLGSVPSPQDEYLQNDTQLSRLRDSYADMVLDRDELLERYGNMRINASNSFYYARSLASRENSIRNVDNNIKNTLSSIEARKAYLEISYREMLQGLYDRTEQAVSMDRAAAEKSRAFANAVDNYKAGIISKMDFLQAEYDEKSALNIKLKADREFDRSLRAFNLSLGRPIDSECPEIIFTEEPGTYGDLDGYIDTALSYSPDIISLKQQMQNLETEKTHLDNFKLPIALDYVREYLETLQINLDLARLRLEDAIAVKEEWVKREYESLQTEPDKLNLAAMDKKLNLEIYETNKRLNSLGYLSNEELVKYRENYEKAVTTYSVKIYEYNTKIKQFEYDCACYNREVYTP